MRVSFFCSTFAQNFKPNTTRSMKNNRIPIGKLVSDERKRQGQSVQWLADRACTSLQNCYKMLHATSLNTDVLRRLSIALNHNFFADYAALLDLPETPPPTLEQGTFNKQFFALIEPILKEAGYKGSIDGYIMTIKKGNQAIDIWPYHEDGMDDVSVCFAYVIRGKFLKQLSELGRIVLAHALSFINPAFNISYQHRSGRIVVKYFCNVHDTKKFIYHLNEANDLYNDLLNDLDRRLPDFLKAFPCPETRDKQLEKTIDHLHRWHIE